MVCQFHRRTVEPAFHQWLGWPTGMAPTWRSAEKDVMRALTLAFLLVAAAPSGSSAQVVESVGSRALGMAGAFVAVANDSSATWWNPAGLAAGPFLDAALWWGQSEAADGVPAFRTPLLGFSLGTPPVGFSYYRLQIINIQPFDPTVAGPENREEGRIGLPVHSLLVNQIGVTVLQTILPGVHAGTTLKYVRGSVGQTVADDASSVGDLLDRGEALPRGAAESQFDLDVGVLAVAGPVRIGGVVRNVREPEFGVASELGLPVRLPRQVRVGAAFDAAEAGSLPLTLAVDADLLAYETGAGERRVVAIGGEHWVFERRLGLRGGMRFNTVGEAERTVAAGASAAVRSGFYMDGHVTRGGAAGEQGWGVAARVSF